MVLRMIIPEILFKIVFYFFRNPLFKDMFYPKYAEYLREKGKFNIYDFSNIDLLASQFPGKVERHDSHYIFNNVTVLPDGFIRFDKNSYFVNDYLTYYLILSKLSNYRKSIAKVHVSSGYMMCGMYSDSFNLFHFLTDSIVPNLNVSVTNGSDRILISQIKNTLQKDILKSLEVVNYSEVVSAVDVDKLKLNKRGPKWRSSYYKNFREKIGVRSKLADGAGKIVYATRKGSARNYRNENDLIDLLRKYNVDIIDFSEFSLQERKDLLSSTHILIGQYGAGLTNLVFMPRGSCVIDLQIGNLVRNDYCLLATACDVHYLNVPFGLRSPFGTYSHFISKDDIFHISVALDLALERYPQLSMAIKKFN
tara:strand:+ start:106 stop:1200 length:1095 start_codon:yes stop_codon:yes gene_type:complete